MPDLMGLVFDAIYSMNLFKIINMVKKYFKSPYFGFLYSESRIPKYSINYLKNLIQAKDETVVEEYELAFSKLIGDGSCISYASARMGFYDLLSVLGVGLGDEVILLGSTCAAMPDAVMRLNASPIFSDLDPATMGSDPLDIEKKITARTRVIVAQHSFGIPCRIKQIAELAKKNNIFLVEDCALCLGSKFEGVSVGNFGYAAIFSTDHSKPINTFIGGMVYTKDDALYLKLLSSRNNYPDFTYEKMYSILSEMFFEDKYCNPKMYGKKFFVGALRNIIRKFKRIPSPYLSNDALHQNLELNGPYPAKLPTFIAAVGLTRIKEWDEEKKRRVELLDSFLEFADRYNLQTPSSYNDSNIDIVPLRFVWVEFEVGLLKNRVSGFFETSWIWFQKPIISSQLDLSSFGYIKGSCPKSEYIGDRIFNIPSNLPSEYFIDLLDRVGSLILCNE